MARVTVAALKMIVRPAVVTVAMMAASWPFPLSRSSRKRDTISKPKSMDNPRPNAVATVSACTETSVTLVMTATPSSVVTIEVMPTAMGRNAAMSPPNTMTSTASEMGSAMLSLTLMIVFDLGPGSPAGRPGCRPPARRRRGPRAGSAMIRLADVRRLVCGAADVDEDETGTAVAAAQVGGAPRR